jgi:hypothetical protein
VLGVPLLVRQSLFTGTRPAGRPDHEHSTTVTTIRR